MKNLGFLLLLLIVPSAFVFTQDTNRTQGSPPSVSLSQGNVDFGEQVTKKPSKPRRLVVTNTSDKKLYVNSVVITEDDQQDFTISNDTCTGKEIDARKSCVLDIVFTPSVNERRKSKLTLTDNAIDSPQHVILTGVGINSVAVPPSKNGNP